LAFTYTFVVMEQGKFIKAAANNEVDIIKTCRSTRYTFTLDEVSEAFREAAKKNHYDTMSELSSWGIPKSIVNDCLIRAASQGNTEVVKSCLNLQGDDIDTSMTHAAKNGHDQTLKHLVLSKNQNIGQFSTINECMINAARSGKTQTVVLCIQENANAFDCAFEAATINLHLDTATVLQPYNISHFLLNKCLVHLSKRGNVDGVKLLLEWGASDLDNACTMAASRGRSEVFDLLKSRGAVVNDVQKCWRLLMNNIGFSSETIIDYLIEYISDMEEALLNAVACGYLETVKKLLARGALPTIKTFECAAKNGFGRILDVLLLLNPVDSKFLDSIMLCAAGAGKPSIVKLLKNKGATNYDACLCEAAKRGHIQIMDLCREWGAQNFELAMVNAALGCNIDAMEFCKLYGAINFTEAETVSPHTKVKNICGLWKRNINNQTCLSASSPPKKGYIAY
jgi:hypothetical protein